MQTFSDLAKLLEVKPSYLNYVLYRMPGDRYESFVIPKKSSPEGRKIYNPVRPLKIIQRKLLQVLECVYVPRCSVYGFIKDGLNQEDDIKRNIVSNAEVHRNQRYVFNIDLANFFPSIHTGRVRGLFIAKPYNLPYKVAYTIAQISCHKDRDKDGLPQGAPISPIISNMICNKMDSQLQRLAQKHKCYYTRYADDITFSTSLRQFPSEIAFYEDGLLSVGEALQSILDANAFEINNNKIRLQTSNQRQEVTGLVVNKFPNVRRKYVRQIRAMLHDWKTTDLKTAQKKYNSRYRNKHRFPDKPEISFRDVVRGKIEFLGMVRGKDDTLYRKYLYQMSKLPNSNVVVPIEVENYMVEKSAKLFLSYAREDVASVQKIHQSLKRIGHEPWMDKIDIDAGEQWEVAIENAMDQAELCILFLSNTSVKKRGYLQKEFRKAVDLAEERLDTDIFIIPVRLDECQVPKQLSKYQWLDFFEEGAWEKLKAAIAKSQKLMEDSET